MTRLLYDTDLTDHQWQILEHLIPAAKPGGRSRSLEMREVLNAIFYLLANGNHSPSGDRGLNPRPALCHHHDQK